MNVFLLVAVSVVVIGCSGLAWAWWQRRQTEREHDRRVLRTWPGPDADRLDRLRAIAASQREDRERWQ